MLNFENILEKSWQNIAPFWPLQNLIATNPLLGMENIKFNEAVNLGSSYFEQDNLPQEILDANVENIKYLQLFFDDGQATINMPNRRDGFYNSWKNIALHDSKLHQNDQAKIKWLKSLPQSSEIAIKKSLAYLNVNKDQLEKFLTLSLITLPGWASYMQYLGSWKNDKNENLENVKDDFLAVRLSIFYLICSNPLQLINWHNINYHLMENRNKSLLKEIDKNEQKYHQNLITNLVKNTQQNIKKKRSDAQFVFCIDVRSEPFRKNIEMVGNYETFGFAGFFGIATSIEDNLSGKKYDSCPVLLKPNFKITRTKSCSHSEKKSDKRGFKKLNEIKGFYQSMKYNFVTPFPLAESIGLYTGAYSFSKVFLPKISHKIKKFLNRKIRPEFLNDYDLKNMSLEDKGQIALNFLKNINLTKNFADFVFLCGHGSHTENNAFASSLECGACGGRHGGDNSAIVAKILNEKAVRNFLEKQGIKIAQKVKFIGAMHNTTSDEVEIFSLSNDEKLNKIKADLKIAGFNNRKYRAEKLGISKAQKLQNYNNDWAQIRPEWGLAQNGSFIIGPRDLIKNIDLEGRSFLHSYQSDADKEGAILEGIMLAPMIVTKWINLQYLFSTINNSAYGAGSKITKNITGKIAPMQGNGSDLMTGLPLQSVNVNNEKNYHQKQRLLVVIYAPKEKIAKIINKHEMLQSIFKNGWMKLCALDEKNKEAHILNDNLKWQKFASNLLEE